MTHWSEHNRFADEIVYVPVWELAACCEGGTVRLPYGEVVPYDVPLVLEEWHGSGDKLDGYILPRPDGQHSIGIRYGTGDSEYLSPRVQDYRLVNELLTKYSSEAAAAPSP